MDTENQPRILALGAHPDDCDIKAGGCAVLWRQAGCTVKFVSVTNGDAGHHEMSGSALAERRAEEARAAGEVAGIEYEVLDFHDGQLVPGLEERFKLLRLMREFRPDLVLTHRPNDYHPDHRYTSQLVQDCSFLVGVPNICPDSPRLERMPAILYFADDFQKPIPFQPDIAVDIDDVLNTKIRMLDCHVSQVYEWLPWIGQSELEASEDPKERLAALADFVRPFSKPGEAARVTLIQTFGQERGSSIKDAECFENCEYGSPVDAEVIERLFPFLPKRR